MKLEEPQYVNKDGSPLTNYGGSGAKDSKYVPLYDPKDLAAAYNGPSNKDKTQYAPSKQDINDIAATYGGPLNDKSGGNYGSSSYHNQQGAKVAGLFGGPAYKDNTKGYYDSDDCYESDGEDGNLSLGDDDLGANRVTRTELEFQTSQSALI